MPALPAFVVHHARTGVVALNVVSAALDADPRTEGAEVHFARTPADMASAIEAATTRGAKVVAGWSFYSVDFAVAAADLARVRELTRGVDVLHVAGGVHATAEPEQTLRAGFDLAAIGEGESTIVEIFAAIAEGRDPRALAGVAYLEAGRLVSHGPGDRKPLDAYPAFNVRHGRWNALEITRGCVYACSFCQTPYMFKARFRHRSVENVRWHVERLREGGCRYVRFLTPTSLSYGSDDTRVNLPAVEALLAAVREAIGPDRKVYFGTFPSECRPEHVSAEALRIIRRYTDTTSLILGAQSGSERVLAETRRGHGVEEVIRAVRLTVEAGLRPDVDFLFGLPGETAEDRAASLRLADRLAAMGARIHGHAFLPLPGTPLRDAQPEPIEPAIELAMARLESRGALYGQWRKQVEDARGLVELRRRAARERA